MANNRIGAGKVYGSDSSITNRLIDVRQQTEDLAAGLSDADATAQSMPDASPVKWHLAHTTWFFEEFVVVPAFGESARYDDCFGYLFNSYYDAVGKRHDRLKRGLLTRPSLTEILHWRSYVNDLLLKVASGANTEQHRLILLGIAHEQQHQELILTDILHLFAQNPTLPAYRAPEPLDMQKVAAGVDLWKDFEGGIIPIGASDELTSFDSERPQHNVLVAPFQIASSAVTNGQWLQFMEAGGYCSPEHWLSDGFVEATASNWQAPLYWFKKNDDWYTMTLRGPQLIDYHAPVCHVSYFEAYAFASWSKARLPTEFEWEHAANCVPVSGNFVHTGRLRPATQGLAQTVPQGMFGDVWEWTASSFLPYPGYQRPKGAIGEYNGKFMSGQMVLRGGSCVTPATHVQATYRNFFHPNKRWQFSGVRLARDL